MSVARINALLAEVERTRALGENPAATPLWMSAPWGLRRLYGNGLINDEDFWDGPCPLAQVFEGAGGVSWEPINWKALGERPPVTPSIGGIVYPGRRHLFSGPPESLKTWAANALGLEVIRAGGSVLHIDFEMFAYETRERLRHMGVSDEELERFLHVEPDVAATENTMGELVERWHPQLAIVDAAAGAFALQGLDDNVRGDAERFAFLIVEPCRARDVATIVIDHVVKNAPSRGAFAIGSERKVGGTDVHLGFEVVTAFGRGRSGRARVVVHKDRLGYLRRPTAAEFELHSDPETEAIEWGFEPIPEDPDTWMPTVLMEKVSRYLEPREGPVSRAQIEAEVTGRGQYLRQAMDELTSSRHIREIRGPRGARLLEILVPYRTSSHLVPTSSHPLTTSSVPVRPLRADGDEVEGSDEVGESSNPPLAGGGETVANGRPLIGDDGYLEYMYAALEAGLIIEAEWQQADRAHRFVVARSRT